MPSKGILVLLAIVLLVCLHGYYYSVVFKNGSWNGMLSTTISQQDFDQQMITSLQQLNNSTDSLVGHPWPGDPTCQHFTVTFAANSSHPRFALTSYPGSGTTFTRQLVEGVSGFYTGTVYDGEDPILLTGHYGNTMKMECDCHILIKDHDGTLINSLSLYDKYVPDKVNTLRRQQYEGRGVLLLRNPADALIAHQHYKYTINQTGVASEDNFHGPRWNAHVEYVAHAWADHAIRWIRSIKTGTVIFYERLVHEDTAGELKRLMNAIGFQDAGHPPINEERMRCTLKHKGRTDRRRTEGKQRVILTLEQRLLLNASIARVQETLSKKGWPLLPIYLYDQHES